MSMHFSLQIAAADMIVSMLQLLLLTAVTQADVALRHITLTTDNLHNILCVCVCVCVWNVAQRHFAQGKRDISKFNLKLNVNHVAEANGTECVDKLA